MINPRRKFITNLTAFTTSVGFSVFFNSLDGKNLLQSLDENILKNPENLQSDEEFWRTIRQAYSIDLNMINLNNGGVSPSPLVVQEAVEFYNRLAHQAPSFHLWKTINRGKESVRKKLANIAGADPETIAINRNATEGLETVIFGLELKKGDEVVLSKYDYPSMINAWKQREKRDGIKLVWVDLDFPNEDKSLIVSKFTSAFSKKTKVVLITHLINWCGQILPVKEIADEAKKLGIEVIVDGAHTFGQMDFNIPDLNCDYFATSLHKWLCAPLGTGMLYVRPEKIGKLYPMFASPESEQNDIRKFEHSGTRSLGVEQAVSHAVDFHNLIGIERKFERLLYLKNYWMNGLKDLPNIEFKTSQKKEFGGAIGFIQLTNHVPLTVSGKLLSEHKIHIVPITHEKLRGIRISPNVYTLEEELDVFIEAMKEILG